ncbi:hypothetical protein WN943_025754 [Citrus x changshan-huyou]
MALEQEWKPRGQCDWKNVEWASLLGEEKKNRFYIPSLAWIQELQRFKFCTAIQDNPLQIQTPMSTIHHVSMLHAAFIQFVEAGTKFYMDTSCGI